MFGDNERSHKIFLHNNEIASSNEEKLLGIFLDSKLNFDSDITYLCKKAGQKLSALARINHYLTPDQKFAIKLRSKIPIQLLSTDLDLYFSIFKQYIKQQSRTSLAFDLQRLRAPY